MSINSFAVDDGEDLIEEVDDDEDVLSSFKDTDVIEEAPKPAPPSKPGTKKQPKYLIRHQSLTPSAEDVKHFAVDKDQLGR